MLRALLVDRFKLKVRRDTREVPVYAMTVARSGFKLHQLEEGSCTPIVTFPPVPLAPGQKAFCNTMILNRGPNLRMLMEGTTFEDFSNALGLELDRPVIDKTGIAGKFDFKLEFAVDQTTPGATPPEGVGPGGGRGAVASDPAGPSIFTAIQEQLGLKLEPAKGPREFLIIDRVERPSAN
jgi:uncharacterized protein (TIGR03435 family)